MDTIAAAAFNKQSKVFDRLNEENLLTQHLREVFRSEIKKQTDGPVEILELNSGTGIDAVYFATLGHHIMATDIADRMIEKIREKIENQHLENNLSAQQLSYLALDQIKSKKFDYIISNFGGLNCTDQLDAVLDSLRNLLNKGGKVTLVIMPKISPWELIMLLKGDIKTAFRRLKRRPVANIENMQIPVKYYSPSYIIKHTKKDFKKITLKGIYFAVPPEFYSGFVERYPKLYQRLRNIENKVGHLFPFNCCCDHYIITLEKIN